MAKEKYYSFLLSPSAAWSLACSAGIFFRRVNVFLFRHLETLKERMNWGESKGAVGEGAGRE